MGARGLWRTAVTLILLSAAFARPVATYGSITEVWRSPAGMFNPRAVSANSADGSVWVADYDAGSVIHVTADGTELLRKPGIPAAIGLSVNSADGSVWVVAYNNGEVLHLAPDGTELWRGGGFGGFMTASVSPTDGSCWVGGVAQVVHLSEAGDEIGRYLHSAGYVAIPSVDARDGSCWASIVATSTVVHVATDGTLLWKTDDMPEAGSVSVNPADGSCWICGGEASDGGTGPYVSRVIHLAADGTQLWRHDGWWTPDGGPWVAVNPKDGSCWVLNNVLETPHHAGLTLVAVDGTVRAQHGLSEDWIADMSADAADGSLWVALQSGVVIHLAAEPDGSPFWDIGADQWAVGEITACANAGIVAGYTDGTYRPADPVTRDQMAVYISRGLAGGDANVPSGPATATFLDVPADYWAYRYIEYAFEQKAVEGYPEGTYRPTLPVDRAQMAVFVARAIATPTDRPDLLNYTPPTTATFSDVPTSHWAYKFIENCKEKDVVQGYPDGTYKPDVIVTRDQMAVYVARAFKLAP